MSTAQQGESESELDSYQTGPKLLPSNASYNETIVLILSSDHAEKKRTDNIDEFNRLQTTMQISKYHSQCMCSSNII